MPAPLKHNWVDYNKAYAFQQRQQNDSAFFYFNKAAEHIADSQQVAMSYNSMAIIQSDEGDHYGALESLVLSLKFLNENNTKDHDLLARDHNEMGMNSADLKNFDDALNFYNKADKFSPDSTLAASIANNRAFCYLEKKDYRKAVKLFREIDKKATAEGTGYARRLTNLATAEWLNDPQFNAAPLLLKALNIRRAKDDFWGLNSSYSHLADYYTLTRPDSALVYADKMYNMALKLNSPDDQLEALIKLLKVAPAKKVKQYFERYQTLNDSLQIRRDANKNQFALIRYRVEKQKAESLQLQKENADKQYKIFKQQVLLYITLTVFIIGTIASILWYRKREQRIELERHNAIRENELRIAKKVHDNVANGLYQLMSAVENTPEVDKDHLVDQLDVLYGKSRDISHERLQDDPMKPETAFGQLLTSFASKTVKIAVVGNSAELWRGINATTINELTTVLLELMVNMKKHSHATFVAIRFQRNANELSISYKDNGVGMKDGAVPGNGFKNTGTRINELNGKMNFEATLGKGMVIHIVISLK